MTRTFKKRVLAILAATTLAAAVGVVCGRLVGMGITLNISEDRLQSYALHMNDLFETYLLESHTVLNKMNASPYPHCSNAEIEHFRDLLSDSEFMRDVGRMRNGKMECAALQGRMTYSVVVPEKNYSQPDSKGYRIFFLFQGARLKSIGVQSGDAFVIFNNFILAHMGSMAMRYSTTVTDAASGQLVKLQGELPNVDRQLLVKDGTFRRDNTLYVTHCSTLFPHCGTAYISVSQALRANRFQISIYTIMGGLIGAFLGPFISIIYRRHLGVEQQLLRAIRRDEVRVVYQPIVELTNRQIVEAEALLRWTDEDGFEISPEVFARIAEEYGFIDKLTALVVRHVLSDFGETLRRRTDLCISVNVTASDLANAKFLPMLERSLEAAGVAAQSLAIEITESSTARKQVVLEAIRQLRRRGHSVQIDDFGTGYSSLAYLSDLSVDAIKIDRAFTLAIGTEAVTVGILPQILAMAKALNLLVIAEGIETDAQAAYFAGAEVPVLGQGWLFGRPVPAEVFLQSMAEKEKGESADES